MDYNKQSFEMLVKVGREWGERVWKSTMANVESQDSLNHKFFLLRHMAIFILTTEIFNRVLLEKEDFEKLLGDLRNSVVIDYQFMVEKYKNGQTDSGSFGNETKS